MPRTTLAAALLALVPALTLAQEGPTLPSAMSETYGAWTLRCETLRNDAEPDGERFCEISQDLRQDDGGQRILVVAIQHRDAGAHLILIAPFGLMLAEGIRIDVAQEQVAEVEFRTCLPSGCLASVDLDPEVIDRLKLGDTAEVQMITTDEAAFSVGISLRGFTAAWSRLQGL